MKKRRTIVLLLICATFILAMRVQNVAAQWTSAGPEGGSIKCMARSGSTIYALAANGYVLYNSTDNGNSWTYINTTLPTDVRAIAVMGNSLFLASISGVYRSDDNGITWVNKSAGFPAGISLYMTTLAVSGTTIFAAIQVSTPLTLIRSTDNGETWTLQTSGLTCNGINAVIATETAIFTGGGSNKKGVFRSINNGDTWQQVTNGMYYYQNGTVYPTYAPNINSFGFNGTDLYAGMLNSQGVWKSSDNGANWVLTNVSTRSNATYLSIIGDGNTVYAGTSINGVICSTDNGANWTTSNSGIDIYQYARSIMVNEGSVLVGTQAGIYKTTDSGVNWSKSNTGMRAYGMTIPAIALSGSDIFVGSGTGGIIRSSDEGNSWTSVNNGLPVNQASEFPAIYAGSATLYSYGRISTNNGNSWEIPNTPGSAGDLSPLPWIEHGAGLFAIKSFTDPGVYRSMDNGATWTLVNNGIDVNAYVFVSIYSDGTTLYLGTDVGYYYSTDNGDNWIPGIFPDYNPWSFYVAHFASTGSAGIMGLYGGGGQQGIFRTTDNGANWTQVNDLLVHKFIVSGSKIWASGSGSEGSTVLLSQDNGQSWSIISGSLNNLYTQSMAVEGPNIYVATSAPDYGVYRSADNGANWTNIKEGLHPNTQVSTLDIVNAKIFAGTQGHSLWQRNLDDFTPPSQPSAISGSSTPCIGSSQTYSVTNVPGVTYAWQFPTGWVITSGGTTSSVTVTVGSAAGLVLVIPSNAFGTGPAQYFFVTQTLSGPSQPGIITGPVNPLEGTSQNYSVVNVTGVTYSWTFPAGWVQTGGDTTNSVTVTVGSGAGNIQVTPSTLCGNGTPRTLAVIPVPAIPTSLTISNIIVLNGQAQCYNATGIIIVGDGESAFLVQSGGQATFIAGQMIQFKPGTKVDSGGYMLGIITTTGQYCNQAAAPMVAVKMAGEETPITTTQSLFRVYPNPTTGAFTLDINGEIGSGMTKVEIFSMRGDRVFSSEISGSGKHELSLSGKPVGIYMIRVISGSKAETARIIKQ